MMYQGVNVEGLEAYGEAPIHDVKAASFGYQNIEHIDLVHLAIADMNEGWNIAAQVK